MNRMKNWVLKNSIGTGTTGKNKEDMTVQRIDWRRTSKKYYKEIDREE